MIEHNINSLNNFICGYVNPDSICDELVNYHQRSPDKFQGEVGYGRVDPSAKQSTDVELSFDKSPNLARRYSAYLKQSVDAYLTKYPAAGNSVWTINERVNIQHYKPSEAYHAWHCERVDHTYPNVARHLVFMTYLNSLDDGETEFLHQDLKVKPQKGLTLIWPADWTFTHRGLPSANDKYIITGWFSFAGRI